MQLCAETLPFHDSGLPINVQLHKRGFDACMLATSGAKSIILERAKINHLAHHFFTTKQTFLWLVRRDIQFG